MRLDKLLEEEASAEVVKRYALHLQQAMLDMYDDVDIELLNLRSFPAGGTLGKQNWTMELHPRFERCPDYQPIIDIEKDSVQPRDDGCLVGISRRLGTSYDKDHIFLHSSKTGAIWPNPNDVLIELDRRMMADIATLQRHTEIAKHNRVSAFAQWLRRS